MANETKIRRFAVTHRDADAAYGTRFERDSGGEWVRYRDHVAALQPQPNLSAAVQTLEKALDESFGNPRYTSQQWATRVREALAHLPRHGEGESK